MAGNVITPPIEWSPDQVLDPEALVDLFVFDGDHLTHAEPGSTVTPPKPIIPLGITAAVTKPPSETPDDTGIITISGSKAAYDATLDYIFKMDGRVQTPKSVAITTGMTAIQVATAVVDQFTDPDVTVKRTGGALEFAPESGSFLAKLTVAIS